MQLLSVHQHIDVARFDVIDAVLFIERESLLQLGLVILCIGPRFVVADQFHALLGGVAGNGFDVEVRIGLREADPVRVFGPLAVPADVPPLDQHALDAVFRGEVDVTFRVFGRGAVAGSLRPGLLKEMHRPPDADIFGGADPRGVLDAARLVEVEHEPRSYQTARRVGDDHRAPRRAERRPGVDLHPRGPRGEVAAQGGSVGVEAHFGVVRQIGLVQGEIPSAGAFQRERRVDRVHPRDGGVAGEALVVGFARGHPPGVVVGRKAVFGQLVRDRELAQMGLFGKFEAEAIAVVEQAEHHVEAAAGRVAFAHADPQLVVMAAHGALFAPDGLPRLVTAVARRARDFEPFAQRRGIEQFESQRREIQKGRAAARHGVADAAAAFGHLETKRAVGRADAA